MVRSSSAPLLLFLVSAAPAARAQNESTVKDHYQSQPSEILGVNGADPAPDYHDFFPIIYVVFGPTGFPHVRAIIDPSDDCPVPTNDDEDQVGRNDNVAMETLYNGIAPTSSLEYDLSNPDKLPYRFPVKLCGLTIDTESQWFKDISSGNMKLYFNNEKHHVPKVKVNPKKFLLLGDTGMRINPSNLGLGKLGEDNTTNGGYNCSGPKVYGVNQCLTNFTKDDLTDEPAGSYQSFDEWHFKEIADSAAEEQPDVIVFVGDYLYRQGPCPEGAKDTASSKVKECSGVNAPSHMNETLEDGTVLNFVPGQYGDNWWGWWADWFYPAMNLLKTAAIIPTRGNHEICTRGGFGYFMLMFPHDVDDGTTNYCYKQYPPYSVKFENEQFLVMDDSEIDPLRGGVDHFIYNPQGCPGAPPDGKPIVPVKENRLDPSNDPKNSLEARGQAELFTNWFKEVETLSQNHATNFYVGHRPILGIGCNDTSIVTLDWTLQESLGPTTLDRISAIITGHMHWLEVLQFEDDKLPPQILVGNGGTMLINNTINQSSIPYIDLKVGKPEYNIQARVKRGLTMSQFGYGIMERQDDGDYEVSFKVYNSDNGEMEKLDFMLPIPKGLRNTTQVSGGTLCRAEAAQLALFVVIAIGTFFFFL